MKNISILTLFLCVFASIGLSQNISHPINWKKGDSKNIDIEVHGQVIKNKVINTDTTMVLHSTFNVIDEDDLQYQLSFTYDNPLLLIAGHYYPSIIKKFKDISTITQIFSLTKDSSQIDYINYIETNRTLNEHKSKILSFIQEKAPEQYEKIDSAIKKEFKTITNKEGQGQFIAFLVNSFQHEYNMKDTLYSIDKSSNPFKWKDFTGANVKTFVNKCKNRRQFEIIQASSYDFGAYKKMLAEMMKKSMNSAANIASKDKDIKKGASVVSEQLASMFNLFSFDASDTLTILRTKNKAWANKIHKKTFLEMKSAQESTNVFLDVTLNIKN
ncbi:hypothetical protein EMN47_16200 [Prolixibacteraceae bacterium JC049]|nr:hypothetical protein [Prolixibacteraceae bacterium JC049]